MKSDVIFDRSWRIENLAVCIYNQNEPIQRLIKQLTVRFQVDKLI